MTSERNTDEASEPNVKDVDKPQRLPRKSVGKQQFKHKMNSSSNQNPKVLGLSWIWKCVHFLSDDFLLPKNQTLLKEKKNQSICLIYIR